MRALAVDHDPLAHVRTVRGAIKPRDRALTAPEWRMLWDWLRRVDGVDGAIVRLHVLLGGQRVQQLARATVRELDREAGLLVLWDGKGRREQPRKHVVPVIPAALAELDTLRANPTGPYLFTVDGGASPADYSAFAHRLGKVVERMVTFNALAEPVTAGDLRRSVETQLAALGVPAEVRMMLQSHGLGSVVTRHYTRHTFVDEMRAALETFARFLDGKGAAVVPLARGRRK